MTDCQLTNTITGVDNAGLENDRLEILIDRKMTDGTNWTKNEGLTLTDQNVQDWKMTDRLTMAIKQGVNVNSGHKFMCTLQPRIAHFGSF